MRVGTLCFATEQGIGILSKAFYDYRVITDVMVVRHGRHVTNDHWYYDNGWDQITNLKDYNQVHQMERFCNAMDVMFFIETPFRWELIDYCRRVGTKTVLCPMYECEHTTLPAQPDLIINPSSLDQQYYPQGVHIPVPVEYPWRQRERARVFVHNAGHGGLKGRNGTAEVLEAIQYVQSPISLIIRSQEPIDPRLTVNLRSKETFGASERIGPRVDLRNGQCDYAKLFDEGDVFVFPEKFNGLSLPLQEARAAGMLVMCGDRFPMNTWLPREPLIPVNRYDLNRIGPPYNQFAEAQFDPRMIAATIDAWYDKDISEYSRQGQEWAAQNSWAVLKPRYIEVLEKLCGN